ncbi:hypothetical protein JY572_24580 [Myxococcus landrumensis]|uniref:Uncharacterized protein n=1 Tax=Myxococcus landrumensis TaxID=2813577 RepID=A0ABX7NQB2_9BACT|nr:hypothetical protein JY572_24580 [Myxococcus landrumus]
MHKRRLGRWRKAKPVTPKKGESSWQYFLRVYGSITWILGEDVDKGLPGFPCGNVSGGGWSCLEVGDDIYDIRGLVQATGNPALPKETRPERIQPFGLWLHQHVTRLMRTAERNLRERL